MKTKQVLILLINLLIIDKAFGASRDGEKLQALKELVAKEELRSKELMARAIRLDNEVGTLTEKVKGTQSMKNLDDALNVLQVAPNNYLTAKDLKDYRFYVEYSQANIGEAYSAVYSRWEAYQYIVNSHMLDVK